MSRPHTARATVAVTLELVVEVSGTICPAEPDVGISEPYIQDLDIQRIGDETATLAPNVDWAPGPQLWPWLLEAILRQAHTQLEEKLFDG